MAKKHPINFFIEKKLKKRQYKMKPKIFCEMKMNKVIFVREGYLLTVFVRYILKMPMILPSNKQSICYHKNDK